VATQNGDRPVPQATRVFMDSRLQFGDDSLQPVRVLGGDCVRAKCLNAVIEAPKANAHLKESLAFQ